jgi:glycosyltransferase involved in cell wall biosynthesis
MRIAVVIPTYNRAHVLGRAVDSVLDQSFPAEQCVVVDDGSSDHTEALVRGSYPGVTYLKQEHGGVSAARNAGVAAARTDWVAFLDSDDAWMPDKLERQRWALEGTRYVICHADEIWIRRGRRVNPMRKHRKRGGWIYRHCLPLCAISPSASMVRKDVFMAIGGFDENLPACEDYDLWLRLCARYPVAYIDRPLVTRYGGHDDQLSTRYWGMDRFRISALEKMLASEALSDIDREMTLRMLTTKLIILLDGARKRGNQEVLDTYAGRLTRCRGLLSRAGVAV